MTIVKYFRPGRFSFNGTEQHQAEYESLQDIFFGPFTGKASERIPEANVYESAKDFRIELVMPGIRKSNVTISLDKNILSVRVNQQENSEGTITVKEYDYTTGQRSFKLPDSIDTSKISSGLENGILAIVLPKRESAIPKGPTDIQIN